MIFFLMIELPLSKTSTSWQTKSALSQDPKTFRIEVLAFRRKHSRNPKCPAAAMAELVKFSQRAIPRWVRANEPSSASERLRSS